MTDPIAIGAGRIVHVKIKGVCRPALVIGGEAVTNTISCQLFTHPDVDGMENHFLPTVRQGNGNMEWHWPERTA